MGEPVDNETAYGPDQDREPPKIVGPDGQDPAELNPDDYGPDAQGGREVNPSTGMEYGEIDSRSDSRSR